jgi:hypothetical protein
MTIFTGYIPAQFKGKIGAGVEWTWSYNFGDDCKCSNCSAGREVVGVGFSHSFLLVLLELSIASNIFPQCYRGHLSHCPVTLK